MKYIDEYRDAGGVRKLAAEIARVTSENWILMEVCGGQTHAILKFGIDEILPKKITLLHGPGCPVCVTPVEQIDRALAISARPGVIFVSFGDMLRVPGTQKDLFSVKAEGGDVRMVYSPLDALKIAKANPHKEVVFFAVGFETTAPANAMAVYQAKEFGITNFSVLVSHVLVPPAIEAILNSPHNKVQGFLAAGHVCTVMGYEEYKPIAKKYRVPIVVTGFEPIDIMQGILRCVRQLEEGRFEVENAYARSVREGGNIAAQEIIRKVFEVRPRKWRGIGEIPRSGLGLRKEYSRFDAELKFKMSNLHSEEDKECIAGLVLRGEKKPPECRAFGGRCTPDHPLGAPMVSTEGACAAYFRYRSRQIDEKLEAKSPF